MRLDSYVDAQGRYMQSMPVTVRMAGFESTTTRLQSQGWQISVETFRMVDRAASQVRVAFKHDGLKQVALGHMELGDEFFYAMTSSMEQMHQYWRNIGIEINCIAPCIQLHCVAMRDAPSFAAIDARPQMGELNNKKILDLSTIALFKPIKYSEKEDFEIYVHQKDEKELLEILLKKQDVRQKEIRQNMKRRAYMERDTVTQELPTMTDKINTDIRAQIMLVG